MIHAYKYKLYCKTLFSYLFDLVMKIQRTVYIVYNIDSLIKSNNVNDQQLLKNHMHSSPIILNSGHSS